MADWESLLILLARVCLGLLFLWAGFRKVLHWNATEDYMRGKQTKFISFLLPIAVCLQIVGGLSIVFGLYTRIGALMLVVFTIPATIQMHDFWNLTGQERIWEKAHFLKDIAIIGGLLLLTLIGGGKYTFYP
jgi:putative oxidoreductase